MAIARSCGPGGGTANTSLLTGRSRTVIAAWSKAFTAKPRPVMARTVPGDDQPETAGQGLFTAVAPPNRPSKPEKRYLGPHNANTLVHQRIPPITDLNNENSENNDFFNTPDICVILLSLGQLYRRRFEPVFSPNQPCPHHP